MAGYSGYSMSNNAVAAYENGEKPLSKWKKADILEAVKTQEVELKCSPSKLQKLPAVLLKEICLCYSSWHHTSSHYNETKFYMLNAEYLETLTDAMVDEIAAEYNKTHAKEKQSVEETWECAFLEWSGTRKHPKATEVVEQGILSEDNGFTARMAPKRRHQQMDSVLSREFRKKKEKTWLWLCLFFVFHIKGCKAKTISERRKHNE